MSRRAVVMLALSAAGCLLLSGCGSGFHGVYNLPLPGGANLGSHPYQVTAEFSDVLDLVPQSGVKVNDVAVGRVTKISLESNGKVADVTMKVNGDVRLPANATASIQQTSLLGEKYVALASPTGQAPVGQLADGARISENVTTRGVQLEQVFGALSLLLNGGGVGQLQTITTELNKAAAGNEGSIRTFLTSADKVIGQLNAHRDSITKALDGLNQLSATLDANKSKITTVLANFSPGLQVLADQRSQLVAMLHALDQLSAVTVRTVNASQADMVADLKLLQPILANLTAAGTALPQSLQILLTYPFSDAAVSAIRGDYLNAFVTTNLNTPGGTIVQSRNWPTAPAQPNGHHAAGAPASIPPPPTLLPSTSSVAAGLSSSSIVTGGASSSATGSPSNSPSGSASGSSSAGGSASGSKTPTGSATSSSDPPGSGTPSDAGSPTGTGGGN